MTTEFYDQRKWLEIHEYADELIATKDGVVLLAVYFSPEERNRRDKVLVERRDGEIVLDKEGHKIKAEDTPA